MQRNLLQFIPTGTYLMNRGLFRADPSSLVPHGWPMDPEGVKRALEQMDCLHVLPKGIRAARHQPSGRTNK